jgi:hypothetical protein
MELQGKNEKIHGHPFFYPFSLPCELLDKADDEDWLLREGFPCAGGLTPGIKIKHVVTILICL